MKKIILPNSLSSFPIVLVAPPRAERFVFRNIPKLRITVNKSNNHINTNNYVERKKYYKSRLALS